MAIPKENALDAIISRDPTITELKRLITQVATGDITVLITGESGTGKELVAKAIHSLSRRKNGPLVPVNCGAIPEGIFESEIFGHEKGSFTSAAERRKGYFEMAHKGSLFLDEIGEMPLSVQVKILRVLETGRFLRVGGSEEVEVDVRVIAATNRDLARETTRGTFRQDLYYRLKAVNLTMPPLRERVEDIPLLVEKFATDFAEKNHRPKPQFSFEALGLMKRQYWAGNVRELKNFTESLIALSIDNFIDAEEIRSRIEPERYAVNLPMVVPQANESFDRELLYRTLLEMRSEISTIKEMVQKLGESRTREVGVRFETAEEIEPYSLDEMEREQIRRVLEDNDGNRRLAARALGIGERTLYRKINRYGL